LEQPASDPQSVFRKEFRVSTLLRYLVSFGVHLAWHRSGRSGAVPPLRLPFGKSKGKHLPLPAIAPWQIMATLWLARKIWTRYGDDIQARLDQSKDALLERVDHLVVGHSKSQNKSTLPPAQQIPTPRPTPNYQTQVLDDASATTPSTNLPAGSVLSGLRGTS
jgi:hypothetical protein